jgi:hypothetical protein
MTLAELGRVEVARLETAALWQELGRNMPPAERMSGAGWWFPNQAVIARKAQALRLAGWPTQQVLAARQ